MSTQCPYEVQPAGNRAARRRGSIPRRVVTAATVSTLAMSIAMGTAMAAPGDRATQPAPPTASQPTTGAANQPAPPKVTPKNVPVTNKGAVPNPPGRVVQQAPAPQTSTGGGGGGGQVQVAPVRPAPVVQQGPVTVGAQQVSNTVSALTNQPVVEDPVYTVPEAGIIKVGNLETIKPTWVTMDEAYSVNVWSAYAETEIAKAWRAAGYSPEEAEQRAATSLVGAGGGALAGGAAGATVGGLIGMGVGATLVPWAAPTCAVAPWTPLCWAGAAGLGIGAGIGAVAVGVPAAATGAAIGAVLGGGDPDFEKNLAASAAAWSETEVEIEQIDPSLEFDFNGEALGSPLGQDAHVNIQVKPTDDGGIWVAKVGDERWFGATAEQRQTHFYDEFEAVIPGSGDVVKDFFEDENGDFQNWARGVMTDQAALHPEHAHYNPDGELDNADEVRAERVELGTTTTPDLWDEPNVPEGFDSESVELGGEVIGGDVLDAEVQDRIQVQQASAPVAVESEPAPVAEPEAPVEQTVETMLRDAQQGAEDLVDDFIDDWL